MSSMVLGNVGQAAGTALGGPVGGVIGRVLGTLVGGYIDSSVINYLTPAEVIEGARLNELNVTASSEGAAIPRVYGSVRVAGQVIWSTNLREEVVTTSSEIGGKGVGKEVKNKKYSYYISFAIAVCEGKISDIGRIWADGKEIQTSNFNFRVYKGTETQQPDSFIVAKQGLKNSSAYRGIAYIFFENMLLEDFGNRIPVLLFEVIRNSNSFNNRVKSAVLGSDTGNGSYTTDASIIRHLTMDGYLTLNTHVFSNVPDFKVTIGNLKRVHNNINNVTIRPHWFGDDLRCGICTIRPKIDSNEKTLIYSTAIQATNTWWFCGGYSKAVNHYPDPEIISNHLGKPAFYSSFNDYSFDSGIKYLQEEGISVTVAPEILMDIPLLNTLIDPITGSVGQPIYPNKRDITCSALNVNGTAQCRTQIEAFVGTIQYSDMFVVTGSGITVLDTITNGELTYRRFIIHYAKIIKDLLNTTPLVDGTVDTFVIGTGLSGLTKLSDDLGNYPFIDALITLAADVKAILGNSVKVTYAAEYDEYFGYLPNGIGGDIVYNMDKLWSDPNIDAVGINIDWALSDWRDSDNHRDLINGASNIYDLDYLTSNMRGGEGYGYYYESDSDRDSQARTFITDYRYRNKNIKGWWGTEHRNLINGSEGNVTSWVAEMKPIWLMNVGCPSIDKGSNDPRTVFDLRKSNNISYYSNGARDDYIQNRYITSVYNFIEDNANNPSSSVYSGRMFDLNRVYLKSWDTRPYPSFPLKLQLWPDGDEWFYNTAINGKSSSITLEKILKLIFSDYKFTNYTIGDLPIVLEGFLIETVMSARAAIQPLELAFAFDTYESGGKVKIKWRGVQDIILTINENDLVVTGDDSELYSLTRGQKSELPKSVSMTYIDSVKNYQSGAITSTRYGSQSIVDTQSRMPIVMNSVTAKNVTDRILRETHSAIERIDLKLPPSLIRLEPSDLIKVRLNSGREFTFRLRTTSDVGGIKSIEGMTTNVSDFIPAKNNDREVNLPNPLAIIPPKLEFMDLPLLDPLHNEEDGYAVAYGIPWRGGVDLHRSSGGSYSYVSTLDVPGTTGKLLSTLEVNLCDGLWHKATIDVELDFGAGILSSATKFDVLSGFNTCAIQNYQDNWEVIQFIDAELIAERTYKLSTFLRGQLGSSGIKKPLNIGDKFVLINSSVEQLQIGLDNCDRVFSWKYGHKIFNINHNSYVDKIYGYKCIPLIPYSVSHVVGTVNRQNSDLIITWIRRTRKGGDNWEIEAPVSEFEEKYELDIEVNGVIVRSVVITSPLFIYTYTMQIEDNGIRNLAPVVYIYQISAKIGRGYEKRARVHVTKSIAY